MNRLVLVFPLSFISSIGVSAKAVCEAEHARIEKGAPGCGPKRESIPMGNVGTGGLSGMYMKTHPSGDYVIVSAPTGMVDLSTRGPCGEIQPKWISSRMNSEVAPVEGKEGWTLLASPNHSDGMNYFQFDDVLSKAEDATSDFQDRDHNQYYQSAAELEGSTKDKIKFRTVLYSSSRFKDYEATRGSDGKYKVTRSSRQGSLCQRLADPNESRLTPQERAERDRKVARFGEIQERKQEIERVYGLESTSDSQRERLSDEYSRLSQEASTMGGIGLLGQIQNPVLSKDGKEISFVSGANYSLKIARVINETECEIIHDLGYQAGKGSFTRPKGGKKGLYVFPASLTTTDAATGGRRYESGVYVLNRDTGVVTKIAEDGQYPGVTDDGRVIYVGVDATGARSLKIVDLNQIEGGDVSKCAKAKSSGSGATGGRK